MDSSKVDNSREVMDRIYEPGPRARPNIDLKYVTYGFAFLQDLVERAIIVEHSGVENPPGILLQQFPYPCFTRDRSVCVISSYQRMLVLIGSFTKYDLCVEVAFFYFRHNFSCLQATQFLGG